jgi:phosphatidylglycerophosphate synthase
MSESPESFPGADNKADCYSVSDRKMMTWWAGLRNTTLKPLLILLTTLRISADGLTFIALIFGLGFAVFWMIYPVAALVMLFLHVLFDGLDGPLARHQGTASRAGSFTDTFCDQLIVTASTIILIVEGDLGIFPGVSYVFVYTVVVAFSMIRNAMKVPYSWLVRPRFFVYLWFPVEKYVFPTTIDIVVWIFTGLLAIKMLSGFLSIRKNLKGKS